MTDFLAKALEAFSSRQGDHVVGDHGKRPVCLNALPRTHKHLAKRQMLFDLLVKGLDPEPLLVQSNDSGLGHGQVVGDQESGLGARSFGNKERYHSDFWQKNDQLGHLEPLFPGGADGLVFSRSLGQVTDDLLDAMDLHVTVPFDGCDVNPSRSRNQIENRGAGIPAVHEGNERSADLFAERSQNRLGQIDFALESTLGASCLGTIAPDVPTEPLAANPDNAGHGALPFDKAIARMMNSDTLDCRALSLDGGVVDDEQSFFGGARGRQPILAGRSDTGNISGASVEKPLKIVGRGVEVAAGNLLRRVELDQTNQPDEIAQEVFLLRFAQESQENREIGRNFFGRSFAYGFHVDLLALAGIGDFGWKPFYLKQLTSFVT
jgi:hypothetical protein